MPDNILTPVKSIRKKCLDCSGGSRKEVRECMLTDCPLHPFRMGKNPNCKPRKSKGEDSPTVVGKERQLHLFTETVCTDDEE